jgi:hypothetical protein
VAVGLTEPRKRDFSKCRQSLYEFPLQVCLLFHTHRHTDLHLCNSFWLKIKKGVAVRKQAKRKGFLVLLMLKKNIKFEKIVKQNILHLIKDMELEYSVLLNLVQIIHLLSSPLGLSACRALVYACVCVCVQQFCKQSNIHRRSTIELKCFLCCPCRTYIRSLGDCLKRFVSQS